MKRICPTTPLSKYLFFAIITLFLATCARPPSIEDFLEDEKVKEIMYPTAGNINVDLDNLGEGVPRLALDDGTTVNMDDTVVLPYEETVTILVTNFDLYSYIEWVCNGTLLGVGNTLLVDTLLDPNIDRIGTYIIHVNVILDEGGEPHSNFFSIVVTDT